MMTISTTSPSLTRLAMPSVPPQIVVALWPLDFSNADTSSTWASLTAFAAMTLTSPACAVLTPIAIAAATNGGMRTIAFVAGHKLR